MNTCEQKISIHIDTKGYCEFINVPDRWHWCKLSKEQIKAIMDILKNAEKNRENK